MIYILHATLGQFFITTIIMGGYTGTVIFAAVIVKRFLRGQQHITAAERETLIRTKETIRYSGALTIVLGALAYAVFLYVEGVLSIYLHFFIIAALYLILIYGDFSVKEKIYRAPPPSGIQTYEKAKFLTTTFKRLLDVNAILLFMFCVVHTRSYPFHGIWGVLAWATALGCTYPSAVLIDLFLFMDSKDPFLSTSKYFKIRKKMTQGLIIVMSWYMADVMLQIGI
jgi:hypothetical protein